MGEGFSGIKKKKQMQDTQPTLFPPIQSQGPQAVVSTKSLFVSKTEAAVCPSVPSHPHLPLERLEKNLCFLGENPGLSPWPFGI